MKPIKRILHALWGLYALLVFFCIALLVTLGVALVPSRRFSRRMVHGASKLIFLCCGIPLEVRHQDRIPDGPCVIVANHASYIDGPLMAAALPPIFSFVIKQEIRKLPLAGLLLGRLGSHFVERFDRKKSARDARRMLESAKEGQALAMFPEGTFQKDPGLMRFRMGAFTTAVRADFPVVPVVIHGARQILPSGTHLPRWGRLVVTVQLPVPVNHLAGNPAMELMSSVRAQMMKELGEPDLAPGTTGTLPR